MWALQTMISEKEKGAKKSIDSENLFAPFKAKLARFEQTAPYHAIASCPTHIDTGQSLNIRYRPRKKRFVFKCDSIGVSIPCENVEIVRRLLRLGIQISQMEVSEDELEELEVDENEPCQKEGKRIAEKISDYIAVRNGQYAPNGDGDYSVILYGERIPLDDKSLAMAELSISAAEAGTLTLAAKIAIQRLQMEARRESGKLTLRKFSAMSQDMNRIYIPTNDRRLLVIDKHGTRLVENGNNEDSLFVEHPEEKPIVYEDICSIDAQHAAELTEELLISSQTCYYESMKYFVGCAEWLFPFVRDCCQERKITHHHGGDTSGKTSGARRFLKALDLGEVCGSVSMAGLNAEGDRGLIVLDNQEQENQTKDIVDWCRFVATGARTVRAKSDGTSRKTTEYRAVAVMTNVEGISNPEFKRRTDKILYKDLKKEKVEREKSGNHEVWEEEALLERITESKRFIHAATVAILQRYLQIKDDASLKVIHPTADFIRYYKTLSLLLHAFADVSGKPVGWADELLSDWEKKLRLEAENKESSSEWEPIINSIIAKWDIDGYDTKQGKLNQLVEHEGQRGKLYIDLSENFHYRVTQCCRRVPTNMPKNGRGLMDRWKNERFSSLKLLSNSEDHPELKKTKHGQLYGIFVPDGED